MKPLRVMKIKGAIASLCLVMVTACNNQTEAPPSKTSESGAPSSAEAAWDAPPMVARSPLADPLQPIPVPNLIPPTAVADHLPRVPTGRADPFSALPVTPTVIALSNPTSLPTQMQPPSLQPAMLPPAGALPLPASALPSFPGASGSAGVSGIPAQPVSLAQAIEITGVVQTGRATSVLLKVPDEHTSRYASVGDRLANGRVLIKRVEMGAEPVVVLEQDGKEISKSIGHSSL